MMASGDDKGIYKDLGDHGARIKSLEEQLSEISHDVREIRDTVTGVKGSWKMLVAVASLFAGAVAVVGQKLWVLLVSMGK
jgi:hypothetical protein